MGNNDIRFLVILNNCGLDGLFDRSIKLFHGKIDLQNKQEFDNYLFWKLSHYRT